MPKYHFQNEKGLNPRIFILTPVVIYHDLSPAFCSTQRGSEVLLKEKGTSAQVWPLRGLLGVSVRALCVAHHVKTQLNNQGKKLLLLSWDSSEPCGCSTLGHCFQSRLFAMWPLGVSLESEQHNMLIPETLVLAT